MNRGDQPAAASIDITMYVAVAPVILSAPLCAADRLGTVPGLLPFLFGLMSLGIPVSLWLRRRGADRRGLNQWVTLVALALGFAALATFGDPSEIFSPARLLDVDIDGQAMTFLIVGITWIVAFRCLTLVSDLDLLLSIGFNLSLFVLVAIVEPGERVLSCLVPFTFGSLYLLMRHQRHVLERQADQVVGSPPDLGWRQDTRTLLGLALAVTVLSVGFSVALSDVRLPSSMVESTGLRLAETLSVWLQRIYTGGDRSTIDAELDVAGRGASRSPAVVFQVVTANPRLWRGNTYRYYDGRSWRGRGDREREIRRIGPGDYLLGTAEEDLDTAVRHTIRYRRPSALVYTAADTVRLELRGYEVKVDAGDRVKVTPALRPGTVAILYTQPGASADVDSARIATIRSRYTNLPRILPERVRRKALRITRGALTDDDKMTALMSWLAENKLYTTRPEPIPEDRERVDYFLFDMDAGWCRHLASALAVMGRAVGVPTRLVSGYTSGEGTDQPGTYLVRERDAHAWVEAWIAGRGWVTYDPTALTTERLSGLALWFDVSRERLRAFRKALEEGRFIPLSCALAVLLLGLYACRWRGRERIGRPTSRRTRRPVDPTAPRLLARLCRELRRIGIARRPYESEVALAARGAAALPAAGPALKRVGEAIADGKFSGRALAPRERAEAAAALAAIHACISQDWGGRRARFANLRRTQR